jgi:glycosyltransferase involved in cell wall biosynthesis
MNIIHLKDSFDPSFEMRDELQFILNALKHGHKVSIVTSNYNLQDKKDLVDLLEKDNKYNNEFEIIRRHGTLMPFGRFIFYLFPFKKLRRNKYDIIFIHNLGSFSSFITPLIKFLNNSKVILKADFSEIPYDKARQSWIYNKLIMFPTHSPDIITCFTHQEKEYLKALGIPAAKINIIPIGIDYSKIPDLTNNPGNPAGKCTIGFIGRLIHQKGLHKIIDPMKKILKEFPESTFIISGIKSDKEYADKFLNSFKKEKNFQYLGFYDNAYDFMKRCDIIIIPSIHESGSIVCLEAMAAGKAIIASDINPHSEYIRSGKNGFLAESPEDYYEIIKYLMKQPTKIQKIGTAARKNVKKYDWENIGKDVEKIYAKLE